MEEDPSSIVIADTSVLINFLAIDRLDLLERHGCRFLITDHVRHEVLDHYHEQSVRLKTALEQGILEEIAITDQGEVDTFIKLTSAGGLGYGECSAIAVAIQRGWTLAIDDKRAGKEAAACCPTLNIITTQDLMVSMIRGGLLSVDEADAIKDEWASVHKFRLKIASFSKLL